MLTKIVLVSNPRSGLWDRQDELEDALATKRQDGIAIESVTLQDDHAWKDQVHALLARGYSTIVVAGGDGTVNSIAALLVDTPYRLGVLPAGTVNHFAKHIGMPLDIPAALDVICTGHTVLIDVGAVNDLPFVNFSSLGLYADIVAKRMQRQRLGWKAWSSLVLALTDIVRHYPLLEIGFAKESHTAVVRTPMVFVGNNRFRLGGLDLLQERESFDSGLLQVAYVPASGRLELLRSLLAFVLPGVHAKQPFTTFGLQTVEVTFPHQPLSVTIDGEARTMSSPLRYTIRPQSLRVIVPKL